MIQKMFAVFDSKARTFLLPFYAPNTEVAQRHFARGAADPNLDIGRFPEDFALWEIGAFDTETGMLRPLGQPVNHGLASLYLGPVPELPLGSQHKGGFNA